MRWPFLITVVMATAISPLAPAQFSFTDLGALGFGNTDLVGLSADGSTIVGSHLYSDYGTPIFIQHGVETELDSGLFLYGSARGIALNGTIVGGVSNSYEAVQEAAVWQAGSLNYLDHDSGGMSASAFAISADGQVIVGTASDSTFIRHAARWVNGQVESLGDLPGAAVGGRALAVSADGSVIVGAAAGNNRAFRWMSGTMEALPLIEPDGVQFSSAFDVSADGRRIVGQQTHFSFLTDGLLWEDGVPRNLGYLPGANKTFPYAISADGSLIFGDSGVGFTLRAFMWDELNGMQDLMQVLSDAGVDLQGWQRLHFVRDVSADGHTLLGYGYNAQGEYSPFIATIPEPGTLALAGVGFGLLARGRRR